MWRTLRQQLPGCEVQIHVGNAPFDDDHGAEFYFNNTRTKEPWAKQLESLRRDLYTSVAVVLREIRRHRPHFIYGMGQGGLVALSMAKPLLVETAMVARVFQEPEVTQVAEAWWAVKRMHRQLPTSHQDPAQAQSHHGGRPGVGEGVLSPGDAGLRASRPSG